MLKRILLSHSPAYFFILPVLCYAVIFSIYPFLNINSAGDKSAFDLSFISGWATSREYGSIIWFIPVAITSLFLPMLTSRFTMFENGMFLISILWLLMIPACLSFSINFNTVIVVTLIIPVYYFIFGMYKSQYPVHLFFNASFIISVATMFYTPSIIFLFLLWAGWLFYNPFIFKAYALSIIGFILPFFFVFSGYFLADKLNEITIDFSIFEIYGKKNEQHVIIFSAFISLFVLIGLVRLAAPGTVKKIGLRKNFNFCLFAFAILMTAVFVFKEVTMLCFAIFPASIVANVAISKISKPWFFALIFLFYMGLMLYFPFGQELFK